VCEEFGPVDRLRLVTSEPAPVGPGSVRLAVSACGVNFVDGLFVQGRYQIKPPLPFVPGGEVVGTIVEAGSEVDLVALGLALGDRVFANVGLGGFASEVVVDVRRVMSLPVSLSDGQAATFVQSYMTGWYALRHRAGVTAGETMLVLGAASGVGLAAVDIGSALGLEVVAAASTEEKRQLALERGAMAVIDSMSIDAAGVKDAAKAFAAERDAAAGRPDRGGVGYVYDPVGGPSGEVWLRALGEDGQYLVIGFVAGIPALPANQVLLRNRRVTGVDWGAWAGRHPDANARLLADVVDHIGADRLAPVEPVAYPLVDVALALQDLAGRRVAGKVVLRP
jgi:NADPH2:quinone reductase